MRPLPVALEKLQWSSLGPSGGKQAWSTLQLRRNTMVIYQDHEAAYRIALQSICRMRKSIPGRACPILALTYVGQQAKRIACGSGKSYGLISDPLRKEPLRRGCDFQFDTQRAPIRGPFVCVVGIAVTTL